MLPAEVKCTTGKPLLPCEGMELLRQEVFAFSALRAGSDDLQNHGFVYRAPETPTRPYEYIYG
jgi:hypothetical protein